MVTSLSLSLSLSHLFAGRREDQAEGEGGKPRDLHADVRISHEGHEDLLHLLAVGPSIGQPQAEDGPNPDRGVGVGNIVADEGKGGVVLILRGGKRGREGTGQDDVI